MLLPSKKLLKRRINMLYPIECAMNEKLPDEEKSSIREASELDKEEIEEIRPTRQAAIKARSQIKALADNNDI